MEHRWGERLLIHLPVHVSHRAFSQHHGRLTDLSVSGARLRAELPLRRLARIDVVVMLPHTPLHRTAPIPAYIVRKYRDGFGLEWCQFAPDPVSGLLREAVHHPYTYQRQPPPLGARTRSRLAGTLLKHT